MTIWRDDRGIVVAIPGGIFECREEDKDLLLKLIPHIEEA